MTDEEFDALIGAAMEELRRKQERLQTEAGLGTHARWWHDAATGRLQFFDGADALAVDADVIEIGTYAAKSNSWMWGWSNDSVPLAPRQRAEKLKDLRASTGLGIFARERAFEVDGEEMAWELAAVAVKHLGALGCYRTPPTDKGLACFLAIMKMELAPGPSDARRRSADRSGPDAATSASA